MAGGVFSGAKLFGMTIRESATDGSDFTNPDADYRRLFLGEDGQLHVKDSAGAVTDIGTGSGIAATIFDAKGDIIVATAADTAARKAAGTDFRVLTADAAQSDGLAWNNPHRFKQTLLDGNGNKTTTSTTKVAIDTTNLAYLTLTLAVNDVVRCTLSGSVKHSGTVPIGFDFEVDRPTSADTFVAVDDAYGVQVVTPGINRNPVNAVGMYVAGEAGSHGFRPAWLTDSGTATLCNASSGNDDSRVTFTIENLGPVAA